MLRTTFSRNGRVAVLGNALAVTCGVDEEALYAMRGGGDAHSDHALGEPTNR
jgi:hypothetical protein